MNKIENDIELEQITKDKNSLKEIKESSKNKMIKINIEDYVEKNFINYSCDNDLSFQEYCTISDFIKYLRKKL